MQKLLSRSRLGFGLRGRRPKLKSEEFLHSPHRFYEISRCEQFFHCIHAIVNWSMTPWSAVGFSGLQR